MRSLITVLFAVVLISVANASPIGNYINDGFNDDFIDSGTWTTSGAESGSIYVQAGAYGNPPLNADSTGTSLIVMAGGNSKPGGLVTSNVAVKPDAGQTVVLEANRYVVGGGANYAAGFGLMVPGGDDRILGPGWVPPTWPAFPSCSSMILLKTDYGCSGSGQVAVQMRNAGGTLFMYDIPGEAYGSMSNMVFADWKIDWSPNRVTILKDGVVKFDTAVNGGVSAIPQVNLDVYFNSGHIFGLSGAEAVTLDVVPEPATMLLLGLGGLALRARRNA